MGLKGTWERGTDSTNSAAAFCERGDRLPVFVKYAGSYGILKGTSRFKL